MAGSPSRLAIRATIPSEVPMTRMLSGAVSSMARVTSAQCDSSVKRAVLIAPMMVGDIFADTPKIELVL